MFLHDNNTVPLVTDLTFLVKIVNVQSHLLLCEMYLLWLPGYTIRRFTCLVLITCRRDTLPLHVQLHNSTAPLLYKLYSLQLNCTYSNYTQTAATCSAAQQHSTFTVQTVQSAAELYLQ